MLYSSFGVVYLAERRKDKKQVAIKCVSVGMDEDARRELKALRNEVQILRACNDPFVVKYHESFMVQKMRSEETWVSQTRVSLSLCLFRYLSSCYIYFISFELDLAHSHDRNLVGYNCLVRR